MSRTILWLFVYVVAAQCVGSTVTGSSNTKVDWHSEPTERGTFSLVWNCIVTIIACTWTVLHLNVPGQNDSTVTKAFRKAKWMIITIIFPEFMFSKAVCELRLALKTLREFRKTLESRHPSGIKWMTSNEWGTRMHYTWGIEKENTKLQLLYLLTGLGRSKPDREDLKEAEPKQIVDSAHTIVQAERETGEGYFGNFQARISEHNIVALPQSRLSGNQDANTITEPSGHGSETDKDKQEMVYTAKMQKWTLSHSYLANMGGLVHNRATRMHRQKRSCAITGSKLGRGYAWYPSHPLEGLILSQEDIADKSKTDALLKTLTIMQISSLTLTVAIRCATELPITQLEVATVAFSVIAVATYAANWWKPQDVSEPIVVPHITSGDISLEYSEADPSTLDHTMSFVSRLACTGEFSNGEKIDSFKHSGQGRIRDLERIPNDMVDLEGDIPPIAILMALSSLAFGGLHCLAWNFDFPSDAELALWRLASISSALMPIICIGTCVVFNYLATTYTDNKVFQSFIRKTRDYIAWLERFEEYVKRTHSTHSTQGHAASTTFPLDLTDASGAGEETDKQDEDGSQKDNTTKDDGHSERFLRRFATKLGAFLTLSKQARNGDRSRPSPYLLSREALRLAFALNTAAQEAWATFESTCNGRGPQMFEMDGRRMPFVESFKKDLLEWSRCVKEQEKFRGRCRLISRFATAVGAILYTLCRLIILVIMFSSLRAVPKEVYVDASWTRYVPNFS